jgi:hypothetical protein
MHAVALSGFLERIAKVVSSFPESPWSRGISQRKTSVLFIFGASK